MYTMRPTQPRAGFLAKTARTRCSALFAGPTQPTRPSHETAGAGSTGSAGQAFLLPDGTSLRLLDRAVHSLSWYPSSRHDGRGGSGEISHASGGGRMRGR